MGQWSTSHKVTSTRLWIRIIITLNEIPLSHPYFPMTFKRKRIMSKTLSFQSVLFYHHHNLHKIPMADLDWQLETPLTSGPWDYFLFPVSTQFLEQRPRKPGASGGWTDICHFSTIFVFKFFFVVFALWCRICWADICHFYLIFVFRFLCFLLLEWRVEFTGRIYVIFTQFLF